jgi:hypothetical protein
LIGVSSDIDCLRAERRIEHALAHPAFSEWLKQALRTAIGRDPVALANDLELLEHLLRAWVEARMARDPACGANRPHRV